MGTIARHEYLAQNFCSLTNVSQLHLSFFLPLYVSDPQKIKNLKQLVFLVLRAPAPRSKTSRLGPSSLYALPLRRLRLMDKIPIIQFS